MNKSIKITLSIIIVLMVIFVCCLTYYKFGFQKDAELHNQKKYFLQDSYIYIQESVYDDDYSSYIINENINEFEYFVIDESDAIYGKIFINDNKTLSVSDSSKNRTIEIVDKKIKTIKNVGDSNVSGLYALALTEDGKLFSIVLNDANLNNIMVDEIELDYKVDKFTSIKYKGYLDTLQNKEVVLTSTGVFIECYTGSYFRTDITNVFDEYMLFDDETVATWQSKYIVTLNEERVKVKNIIYIFPNQGVFEYNPNVILITQDNKIIYKKNEEEIYDYGKIISNITYRDQKFEIIFRDNTKISFSGMYDEEKYDL